MRGEKIEQLSGQKTFASCTGWDCRRKATRRHLFLQTMNQIMPWQALLELVEPYQPKQDGPGRWRQTAPVDVETVLSPNLVPPFRSANRRTDA